jgi:ABC-2 type transport system ATP-binding protein
MKAVNAIIVSNLSKSYGNLQAVDGVSFSVEAGEIFSLLGPNGAGKTTTIGMLSGLTRPDAGDAQLCGHSVTLDSIAARRALGVVPQEISLYTDLSARENLMFWGKMYGLRGDDLKGRVDEVLEIIGLTDRQKGRIETFSGGMKRRVNIGVALMHKPEVVIMDEPTVGIDPQSRRHILDSVKELNRQGMTVLYTTHYMEEAEELSNHIAIMDQGKIIACGTHAELVRVVGEQTRVELEYSGHLNGAEENWRAIPGISQVSAADGKATILVDDSNLLLPRVFEAAAASGLHITSVNVSEPNLEAVFLHLTGRALRD